MSTGLYSSFQSCSFSLPPPVPFNFFPFLSSFISLIDFFLGEHFYNMHVFRSWMITRTAVSCISLSHFPIASVCNKPPDLTCTQPPSMWGWGSSRHGGPTLLLRLYVWEDDTPGRRELGTQNRPPHLLWTFGPVLLRKQATEVPAHDRVASTILCHTSACVHEMMLNRIHWQGLVNETIRKITHMH